MLFLFDFQSSINKTILNCRLREKPTKDRHSKAQLKPFQFLPKVLQANKKKEKRKRIEMFYWQICNNNKEEAEWKENGEEK